MYHTSFDMSQQDPRSRLSVMETLASTRSCHQGSCSMCFAPMPIMVAERGFEYFDMFNGTLWRWFAATRCLIKAAAIHVLVFLLFVFPSTVVARHPGHDGSIYANTEAFAAITAEDGSVLSWGDQYVGGSGAPRGTGFSKVFSTRSAFCAMTTDGRLFAWGERSWGGSGAPSGSGYRFVASTQRAFAAIASDGSIRAWGDAKRGGSGTPDYAGYVAIASTTFAFAALDFNGAIYSWGDEAFGGRGAPRDFGYTAVASNDHAFAALAADGSIFTWGNQFYGGARGPQGTGFTQIFSTAGAFAALGPMGSITAWGLGIDGGVGAPTDDGYVQVHSTSNAFAALKADGTMFSWGGSHSGFIDVAANGSMIAWTTPNFVFFTCPSPENWEKGHKAPKPKVLKLCIRPEDQTAHEDSFALEEETVRGFWQPVKFDAATAKDEDGLMEREIISYSGKVQMRWNVRQAKAAWQALNDGEPDAPAVFFGAAHVLENNVFRHMTVMDDLDIVALEGEIVRSLHF
mmetsp:Transcript_41497/g.91172  ORF Transcript_41497/g.91172 Transcript_41497/m.91172 type:complete len:515 (+) Transcript_41497:136-1680(+)